MCIQGSRSISYRLSDASPEMGLISGPRDTYLLGILYIYMLLLYLYDLHFYLKNFKLEKKLQIL